jgi:nitrous oxidase accessory protein NosD
MRTRRGRWAIAILAVVVMLCSCAPGDDDAPATSIRVPADATTIQAAVDRIAAGGVITVDSGTYAETVTVPTPDVTIRGADRNDTIIDGQGSRPYGVVAIADGVRIQNLTVRNHLFYGVLVTGLHDQNGPRAPNEDAYEPFDPAAFPPLQRFLIDHVTAHNNGLYGIYAFNAQHGVITNSYASGSADSGLYVGQCRDCDVLVQGNVAERNAVGFENANASGPLTISGNRFADNRVGLTLLSNYQEAFRPQQANNVVGNVIADNAEAASPAQADGGFGTGIGIAGGQDNSIDRNRITGNPRGGVLLTNTEDLPAQGNAYRGNIFADNGTDLANLSADRAPATNTCVDEIVSTTPSELAPILRAQCRTDASTPLQSASAGDLPEVDVPPGANFLKVAPPPPQPVLPDSAPTGRLPDTVSMPDLDAVTLPPADLLMDRSGTR